MPRFGTFLCIAVFFIALLVAAPCYSSQIGACCYPPTWECFLLTEEECSQQDGYYWLEGADCDPGP